MKNLKNKKISSRVGFIVIFLISFFFSIFTIRACDSFEIISKRILEFPNRYYGLVTILGWFFIFLLNSEQQKKQLQNNAKMKVYEEIYNLKKELDNVGQKLDLLLNPFCIPFLEMKYSDTSIRPNQINLKALEIWRKYLGDLSEKTYLFVGAYLKLWIHFKMWISAMPELSEMYKEFFEVQLQKLTKNLNEHHKYLQDLSIKNLYWETWNQEEIREKSRKLAEEFNQIAVGYLDDLMVEMHNCLIGPILESKIMHRTDFKNLPERYKILTKDGIKEIKKEK